MIKRLLLALGCVAVMSSACSDVGTQLDDWQAVFLTSGQVYYGKLTDASGPFYTIEDVYYIRATPAEEEGQPPQLTLVKMGNELHGPEDMILLNRDHVLYVENLKADGQVMQRIQEAKAAIAAGTDTTAAPAPLPTDQLSPEEMEQFRKFQDYQQQQATPPAAAPAEQPAG